MTLIKISNDRIVCPEGPHDAVLAAVFSLGLQPGYNGEKPKPKHAYVFELADKIPSGDLAGKPYVVSIIMTDSLHEKSRLFAAVKALKGGLTPQDTQSGFDPASMVGLSCTLVTANHIRAGKAVTNIESIYKRDPSLPKLVPTQDWSKVPAWVLRIQSQQLDKSADHAA